VHDYGNQILQNGILDVFLKPKNWLVTRIQHKILNIFGKLPERSHLSCYYSRIARRFVGGYLYSIKLEANNRCLQNCKICYVPKGDLEIPYDVIVNLLDQIRSFKIRFEILGGEPLLHRDIVRIVEYAKKRSKVPFVSLYTNGILATSKMSQELKRAGLDAAIVSLISHKSDVHDECTGNTGSWLKAIKGIRNLALSGLNVYTFTPINRMNFEDYQDIYHFVKKELKVKALFYPYIPQTKDDPFLIEPEIWHTIKHWILVEKNREHMEFVRKFFMLTGNVCSGGNFVLTVKADGSVQPCPFISDISLGNIYQDSIWTIYKKRFHLPKLLEFKSIPYECEECSYKSVCGGGCKAGNQSLFCRYNCKDHKCLGPYRGELKREDLIDCVPSFF
jgi:radical SAM protein with 4Fe4S-binding SPASM domain